MNKQEYQKTIKDMKPPKYFSAISFKEAFNEGFETAKNEALFTSCFIDEQQPNKQKLIKKIESEKYDYPYSDLAVGHNSGIYSAIEVIKEFNENEQELTVDLKEQQPFTSSTPPHYQGTIQPIDLINAQDLNFNLGNVVKYVCRAGKKQGENILTDLEKAKDYINFEIERIKKWI